MKKQHNDYKVVPYPKLRRVLAVTLRSAQRKSMVRGLIEVDVTRARAFLREHKANTGESLSFTGFIIACLAHAVDENKFLHACRKGRKHLVLFEEVDVSTLIERNMAGQKQPIVYIIRAANKKTFREIHQEIREAQVEAIEKSWEGYRDFRFMPLVVFRLIWPIFWWMLGRYPRVQKKYGGTLCLSAVGMFGKGAGWGIPITEHTLDLTLGGIAEKPGVVDGQITIHEYLSITLSFDHDLIDGAPAARFTQRLKELIESGYGLDESTVVSELVGAKAMSSDVAERLAIHFEGGVPMNTIVKTQYGEVCGSVTDGVHTFKGIPYAAPPFGANRLRPPQPVAPWSGVRDALAFGPTPPQTPFPPQVSVLIPQLVIAGSDCLNLNIWSPDIGSARQPVMVWLPGGRFEYGTGSDYDGSRFARDGIVCVTINYRLGVDGFLSLGDGIANCGLLDQIAALQWVRENIAAFGGDPANVTVFGESAGAISIGTLLSMPRAQGLFHRAIAESGATHLVMSAATARRVGEILAEKLGVEATREAIAAVPVERLLAAQAELDGDLAAHPDPERWGSEVVVSTLPWQPVVDGDVIPARPIDRIIAGAGAGIDILVGTNTDEERLFPVTFGAIDHVTDEALAGAVAAYGLPVEATLAAYRAAHPNASAGDLLAAIQTDWYWRIPAIRLADAHAKSSAGTYMYEFAWRSPQFNGRLGACHGLEIPFVLDTLGNGTEPLLGTDPPQQLADTMHAAWVAFATRGDPGWPTYELSRRATMRFDTTSEVVDDPRSAERALWEGLR